MAIDPQLHELVVQLMDTAVRNTAGSIADRIRVVKARKRDQETIAELEQIVNELLSDKNEAIRIAQAFEQQLIAQQISDQDVEYISTNFIPVFRQLIEWSEGRDEQNTPNSSEMIDLIQPLLSVETVTILQLIGFNIRQAIGEPLTKLVSNQISSRTSADTAQLLEIQRLNVLRENNYLEVAKDPEAYERLVNILRAQQSDS
jgi:hypothetical protein